ncbi:hypothetical protein ScPMuIL_003658 [Solemya velum]
MASIGRMEKRILLATTVCTLIAYVLQIIAVCTNEWLISDIPGGLFRNVTGDYLIQIYGGLWRKCFVTMHNKPGSSSDSEDTACSAHQFFPSDDEVLLDKTIDHQILDYIRTGSAFGIISLVLMLIGHVFAVYTLKRPRYIIKRLTALLHIMTAVCVLVLNEVFIRTTEYSTSKLPGSRVKNAKLSYGYSFALSWLVFVVYVLAGIVFLLMSHKKKTEMADIVDHLAEEDEPVTIGRI